MSDAELIKALGGAKVLAQALGLPSFRNVRHWERRGIAHRWRPAVADLASRSGVRINERDFLRIPPAVAP
jgi:hypothetical protein